VTDEERAEYASEMEAMMPAWRAGNEDDSWFKVDWERVPDLVESRRVLLKRGKAYVPGREQLSMITTEFSFRLERQLEVRSMESTPVIHSKDLTDLSACSSLRAPSPA
jgi:DNA primase large subunit